MDYHPQQAVKKIFNYVFLLIIFVQIPACGSDDDLPLTTVEISEIISGATPTGVSVNTRKAEVFRDQQTFSIALNQYANFFVPVEIDFSTHQVVLLTMQQFLTGGYDIKLERADDFEQYVALTIKLTYPGAGCLVTAALSAPYQFASINTIKPIVFQEYFEETVC